jgi:hypothetical protein
MSVKWRSIVLDFLPFLFCFYIDQTERRSGIARIESNSKIIILLETKVGSKTNSIIETKVGGSVQNQKHHWNKKWAKDPTASSKWKWAPEPTASSKARNKVSNPTALSKRKRAPKPILIEQPANKPVTGQMCGQ